MNVYRRWRSDGRIDAITLEQALHKLRTHGLHGVREMTDDTRREMLMHGEVLSTLTADIALNARDLETVAQCEADEYAVRYGAA